MASALQLPGMDIGNRMNYTEPEDGMVMAAMLVARQEKQEELAQTLEALLGKALAQAGCLEGMVTQDLGGRPRFLLYLSWESRDAMKTYTGSEGFQILLGASSFLLREPARFRFFGYPAQGDNPYFLMLRPEARS